MSLLWLSVGRVVMAVDSQALRSTEAPSVPGDFRHLRAASATTIAGMADNAGVILDAALAAALAPDNTKVLRTWNLREVCEWIRVPRRTLERAIDEGAVPAGVRVNAARREFTLKEMHQIQDALGVRPGRGPEDDPLTIAIANLKGGASKTSTAIHLAQYSALRGYRVLMVDLDAQGSATTMFGLRPYSDISEAQTLAPWLYGPGPKERPNETWTGTLATAIRKTYWDGLDLIGANMELYGAEFGLSGRLAREPGFRFYSVLKEGLATVRDDYDLIILDTPPSLSFLTANALWAADGLIVPVPPAPLDFAASVSFFRLLAELLQSIDVVESSDKRFDFLGLLVSKYEASNPSHVAIHDWLRAAFSNELLIHTMSQTTILKLGADIQSAYEIARYEGNRRTLQRALDHLNGVNGEIESVVQDLWAAKRSRASKGNPSQGAGGR